MAARERFEAWLEADQAASAHAWIALGGYSGKAEFVRDCLLGNFAGRSRLLESRVGSLALALNELRGAVADSSPPAEAEIRSLIRRCDGLQRRAARELRRGRCG